MFSKLKFISQLATKYKKGNNNSSINIYCCRTYNGRDEIPEYIVSKENLSEAFSNLLRYKGNDHSMGVLLKGLDTRKKGFVDHDSLVTYLERMKMPKAEEIKVKLNLVGKQKEKLDKGDLRQILGWDTPRSHLCDAKEDSIDELLEDGIKLFDSDKDGLLSQDEFVYLYSSLLFVADIVTSEA